MPAMVNRSEHWPKRTPDRGGTEADPEYGVPYLQALPPEPAVAAQPTHQLLDMRTAGPAT